LVTIIGLPDMVTMSMSVCLSVHSHNSKTARLNFIKFWGKVACGRGSVLLQQHCDVMYFWFLRMTSCFHITEQMALGKIRLQDRLTHMTVPKSPIPSVTSDICSVW